MTPVPNPVDSTTVWARSLKVIKDGQAESGAFVAGPDFATYGFSWLRDGGYIAHALDRVGETERSAAFHGWVVDAVERLRPEVLPWVAGTPSGTRTLPARFTLDGHREEDAVDAWPNFQLDGYGTWLWTLVHHLDGRPCPDRWRPAARLVADYLRVYWEAPCHDYWEEYGDRRHTSTLVAVAAGLRAATILLRDDAYLGTAAQVEKLVRDLSTPYGRLLKGPTDDRLDGSLLSAALPFGLLAPDEPLMRSTVRAIERDLTSPGGGIRRYVGDTYYGGGSWVLLTCWLGWYHKVTGDDRAYRRHRDWVLGHATPDGLLPEQITGTAQAPEHVEPWTRKWGPPANPLLWSHAMYLLMESS